MKKHEIIKKNANDYAIHLYVYTLFIYIDNGIMRKFGVEKTTVLSKSYKLLPSHRFIKVLHVLI